MKADEAGRTIRVLDLATVNQIAAGEVVERPASVVKELVENAIDAGARTIRIDITSVQGGISSIRVTDDGCGMSPADAELAFAPHATSKITAIDDLFKIHTLGLPGRGAREHRRRRKSDAGHKTPGQHHGRRDKTRGARRYRKGAGNHRGA